MTISPVLFSAEDINKRVDAIARDIAAAGTVGEGPLLLIGILKGGFVFTADLLRALSQCGVDAEVDFMGLSSYGAGRASSGKVKATLDLETSVAGRDVLVVDDVLETGTTLAALTQMLAEGGAKRVRACVFLDKPGARKAALEADFVGFAAPDAFVVGYGMDVAGKGRGLPFIGTAPDADQDQ